MLYGFVFVATSKEEILNYKPLKDLFNFIVYTREIGIL